MLNGEFTDILKVRKITPIFKKSLKITDQFQRYLFLLNFLKRSYTVDRMIIWQKEYSLRQSI